MATPENCSPEPNASENVTIEHNPPSETGMSESVNAAISSTSDFDARDSVEVLPEEEQVGDNGSSAEDDNTIKNPGGIGSDQGVGDEEDGNDCGPWPTNSTYEWSHEPFETYKLKVNQLCRELGLGESLKVKRMDGGGFNRIIGLEFPTGSHPELVLRIPRILQEHQFADLKTQVAVLSHLSKYPSLHVPKVLGYDSTIDNALGQMYVLQEKLPGVSAADVFYDLPISEKLEITTLVAEMLIELESVGFEKPGRPVGASSMPPKLNGASNCTNSVEIAGFRYTPIKEMESLEKQSLTNLLVSLLDLHKERAPNPGKTEMVDRLKEIAGEMESAGLMRITDSENVIWHWDLSGNNVMIQRLEAENPNTRENIGSPSGCHHSVDIKVEEDAHASRHNIQVQIEDNSGQSCNHKVEVMVESLSGKKYRHAINISSGAGIEHTPNTDAAAVKASSIEVQHGQKKKDEATTPGKWAITGVIDWDDALSVPLVLSRKPPSWLWFEEKGRDWTQNRDDPPERDLVDDELLIKGHFDQIMEKARPGYIEDTYHRGIWLRKLGRFALQGFKDSGAWKRYEAFVGDWDAYYSSLRA